MEHILKYLTESKADDEFEKVWSKNMDRQTFDDIVCLDPTTKIEGDNIINIGFIAKGFLLPRYVAGETDFIADNKYEELQQQLADYKQNIAKYPKIMQFKSVADFMTFMENPDEADIEIEAEKQADGIYDVYEKYYKDKLSETDFDICVNADPATVINTSNPAKSKMGDLAKQLLLPKAANGEAPKLHNNKFLQDLHDAINNYWEKKDTLAKEDTDWTKYSSIDDFIDKFGTKVIDSSLITALKNNNEKDQRTGIAVKDSFELLASTPNYDVIMPTTQWAAYSISGGWQSRDAMHWCTGWDKVNGRQNYQYWDTYQGNSGGPYVYIDFMKKGAERGYENRIYNWQIAINKDGTGAIYDFLNGHDAKQGSASDAFYKFLMANRDVCLAIKDLPYFANCPPVIEAYNKIIVTNVTTYEIDSNKKLLEFIKLNNTYVKGVDVDDKPFSVTLKSLTIKNIKIIPQALCVNFGALTTLTLGEGIEIIDVEAFKNCVSLTTLQFPESLKEIRSEAFAGCTGLKGSIKVPNNVEEIGFNAFSGVKNAKLKIDQNKPTPLYFDERNKDWVMSHVQSIKVQ